MRITNNSSNWGIKGGGFGLYGYLPALCHWQNQPINIEKKHQESIKIRPELAIYSSRINWVPDECSLLKESSSLVLCVPPVTQKKILSDKLSKHYQFLILEKPIAATPLDANQILGHAILCAHSVRIGYILISTNWAKYLLEILSKNATVFGLINIRWHFLAHHIKQNDSIIWKSQHAAGGGVLRFYGIHLIAILAIIDNVEIIRSQIYLNDSKIPVIWCAIFIVNKFQINIDVNTSVTNEVFSVSMNDEEKFNGSSPFNMNSNLLKEDFRVSYLIQLLNKLHEPNKNNYDIYRKSIQLWMDLENKTTTIQL